MSKKVVPMPPDDFRRKMEEINKGYDTEATHAEADDLMCNVLASLGYGGGVEIFRSMHKWYA